jgi:hypothetical protein
MAVVLASGRTSATSAPVLYHPAECLTLAGLPTASGL